MPPALTGALGGKVLPFLDAPGLVPPLRPFLPRPKDCLRPQSLLQGREGLPSLAPCLCWGAQLGCTQQGLPLTPKCRLEWFSLEPTPCLCCPHTL